jgi:hypothetical protein
MDACTDAYNVTDCLLEQILEASKETDTDIWDILSFVATLLIGFAALLFAILTIWQASAGPGHCKSSDAAIGNWADLTHYRWNYSELSRQAIAYTPVMTTAMFQHIADTKIKDMDEKPTPGLCRKLVNRILPKQKRHAQPLGTWLLFLRHTGFEHFTWFNCYQRKQTNVDYLPSEFQAAPAYLQADVILALAAASGCYMITLGPDVIYPLITGPKSQVRFRPDTPLGTVGSFEVFEYTQPDRELEEQTERANMYNLLQLPKEELLRWIRSNFCPVQQGRWPIQYADDGRDLVSRHEQVSEHIGDKDGMTLCQCSGMLQDIARQHDSQWLLCAEPLEQREVFPADRAEVEGILATTVIQGTLWSPDHSNENDLMECLGFGTWGKFLAKLNWIDGGHQVPTNTRYARHYNGTPPGDEPKHYQSWEHNENGTAADKGTSHHGRRRRDFSVADGDLSEWEIFALAFRLLITDSQTVKQHFFSLARQGRIEIRKIMAKQIQYVDEELFKDADTAACVTLETAIVSAALLRLKAHEKDILTVTQDVGGIKGGANAGSWSLRGGRASTDRTIRSILSMLQTADQREGDALAQLYRLLVRDVFPDCQPRQVDILIQALARLSLKRPAKTEWNGEAKSPIDFIMREKKPREEDRTTLSKKPAQEASELDRRCIRDLLIYRSLLFAYICLTTLDNSAILESGIGNHIVPFI